MRHAPTIPSLTDSIKSADGPINDPSSAVQKLSPFIRPPADAPILVATEDEPLALLLNAAPKLQRSVIVIKEHALSDGTAALSILSSLSENGLNAIGVRLCHLPSALGSSAQLGLDTPLSSGPVLALLVDGHEPTDRIQALAGASDPKLARSTDVGSWRAKLGIDRNRNLIATPRHAKGAQRASSYFFGPRTRITSTASASSSSSSSTALPTLPIGLVPRQPREAVILLLKPEPSPSTASIALLMRQQSAGLALHAAVRLEKSARDDLKLTSFVGDDATPRLAFLLSREGDALHHATDALTSPSTQEADVAAAASAALLPCPPQTATAFAALSGPPPCALSDLYKYTSFTLKNELL